MSAATKLPRMTADEFLAWAMEQHEGQRYELMDGEVVGMDPERAAHARAKGRVFQALAQAIRLAGLPCEAFPDGMSVRIDRDTVYEPDALVHCGSRLDDDAIEVPEPLIVVEIVSPSSSRLDSTAKLLRYFRVPSVRHYLIITTGDRTIVHHERDETGTIAMRIIRDGPVRLDPPGIELAGVF